jgi:hypothetical protein
MIFTMGYCITIFFLFFPIFSDQFSLTFDSKTGVFGWLRPENFLYSFFAISLYSGVGNLVCYSIALQYYSAVVLGNALLLEPIVGQFFGLVLGLD